MKQKTRDNLVYLGVAGAIAALVAFYVFYTDKTLGRIPKIPQPLLWGIFSTLGIFALVLERFWQHRRRLALWVILVVAAAVNVTAVLTACLQQWNPSMPVWSTFTTLWVVAIFVVGDKLLAS